MAETAPLARLLELFEQAIELPPAQWPEFARGRCGGDAELEARLLGLLERDRSMAGDPGANPFQPDAALAEALPGVAVEGLRIGPFRVAERIGDGGMGSVYRAVRVDGQVQQEAALKLVRADRVNPYLMRRFSIERRVLAALDHPGICRFLDAGVLAGERPYVLMELVRGQPLLLHCDSRRLGLRERLILFRKVLAAVAHAHRNLVVHRDIKSSNVLVTAEGQPKLLDFGIAKTLWDATAGETATAERFLTPTTAAPEQLAGKPVTVSADVYALGALLYELLCGVPPFAFDGRSPGEIERMVRDLPPDAMSRRVHDGDTAVAAARGFSAPTELVQALRGDLDLIALTCLRKQAEERYASVEQLDLEIERVLQGRPIQARSNERWYRVRKFVARNRVPVVLSTGFALILAVGVGVIVAQSFAMAEQRNLALLERDRARSAVELLRDAFTAADPARVAGADVTARDILASAKPELEARFETQPELYASLAEVLADVELAIGLDAVSAQTAKRGLEAADRAGMSHEERRKLQLIHARSLIDSPARDEAERLLDQIAIRDGQERADWLLIRGRLRATQGKFVEAIELLLRAAGDASLASVHDADAVSARWLLAHAYSRAGEHARSVATYDGTLAWLERELGPDHPRVAMTRMWRMSALREAGRLDEALAEADRLTIDMPDAFGQDSVPVATMHMSAGLLFARAGDKDAAYRHHLRSYEIFRAKLGADHPNVGRSAYNAAEVLRELDRDLHVAEALYRDALRGADLRLGAQAPTSLRFRSGLASVLKSVGRIDEAFELMLAVAPEAATDERWRRTMTELREAAGCDSTTQDSQSDGCRRSEGFRG